VYGRIVAGRGVPGQVGMHKERRSAMAAGEGYAVFSFRVRESQRST
jgi:hypothetical protein